MRPAAGRLDASDVDARKAHVRPCGNGSFRYPEMRGNFLVGHDGLLRSGDCSCRFHVCCFGLSVERNEVYFHGYFQRNMGRM